MLIQPRLLRAANALASPTSCAFRTRLYATHTQTRTTGPLTANTRANDVVNIVEVGPRDGLQNEKGVISTEVKVELINRLVRAGVNNVEAGSFVSPKWVPQMAGTAEVLSQITQPAPSGVHYAVLVPNQKGLANLQALLSSSPTSTPLTDEISIFTAATDAFTRANLNTTISASLAALEPVARAARDAGMRVRGYVSVVVACPYSGAVDPQKVKDVAGALIDMGCYEVSLGDTVGRARPDQISTLIQQVEKRVPVEKLAGHFHDTYGTAIANVMAALSHGIRTIDSSVGGLGGCPYSPGATGNVATEDVLYALQGSRYKVAGNSQAGGGINLDEIAEIGWWVSEKLGRESVSRVGRALKAQKLREKERSDTTKAKL